MKLGIISDTHDRLARTALAMRTLLNEGIDALVHCGDVTTPEIVVECAGVPSWFVFGNNDYDQRGLERAMASIDAVCLGYGDLFELGGRRIAVTHGDSGRQLAALSAKGPDLLLYGHTHVAANVLRGPTRWVNPGALHRAARWTVAVIDLESLALRFLDIEDAS
ncbi:MAG: YfcE family phosphodiesterase [Isosphaeraceae bacterium]|nr:YfcE family phosphodiesterase [Isosphaeraceae bacterium]